jgi:hypothetical protein
MISRIKGILLLDGAVFREVEHDSRANGQAALVVIVSSFLAAIGASFDPLVGALASGGSPWDLNPGSGSALLVFAGITIWSIVAWFVWSAATYLVGAKIFSGKATFGQMLRLIGFAYAPLAFLILSLIPCIGFAISLVVTVWSLAAVFVAVQEGLELSFGATLATVLAGWLLFSTGMVILGGIFGLF